MNAFKPADKIQRSPPAAHLHSSDADVPAVSSSSVPCVTAADAAGPLTSTLIDASDDSVTDVDAVDTVAMKLFAHGMKPYVCLPLKICSTIKSRVKYALVYNKWST